MNRPALQAWLEAWWYDATRTPPFWLRLLAAVHAQLLALRLGLYRRGLFKVHRLGVPVIVIGNLSVGGTGKTPLTIALVQALRARGWQPGVVSRGYAGSAERPLLLGDQSVAAVVGDEPLLIRQRTGAPVAVGRDRVAAAQLLLAAAHPDVLIADDGLQHYALVRDIEINVLDGERRYGNARLLPAGPLREPLARLDAVEFRVCNGGAAESGEVAMQLHGEEAVSIDDRRVSEPLAAMAGQAVHAVAAIGNPARFFAMLRAHGLRVTGHAFPDHQPLTPRDLSFGDGARVLMTEKDAVKFDCCGASNLWFVPVSALLPESFFDAVHALLEQARARAGKD